jgi:hypothetical protein
MENKRVEQCYYRCVDDRSLFGCPIVWCSKFSDSDTCLFETLEEQKTCRCYKEDIEESGSNDEVHND